MGHNVREIEEEMNLGWRLFYYAIAEASILQQQREAESTKQNIRKSSGYKPASSQELRQIAGGGNSG